MDQSIFSQEIPVSKGQIALFSEAEARGEKNVEGEVSVNTQAPLTFCFFCGNKVRATDPRTFHELVTWRKPSFTQDFRPVRSYTGRMAHHGCVRKIAQLGQDTIDETIKKSLETQMYPVHIVGVERQGSDIVSTTEIGGFLADMFDKPVTAMSIGRGEPGSVNLAPGNDGVE